MTVNDGQLLDQVGNKNLGPPRRGKIIHLRMVGALAGGGTKIEDSKLKLVMMVLLVVRAFQTLNLLSSTQSLLLAGVDCSSMTINWEHLVKQPGVQNALLALQPAQATKAAATRAAQSQLLALVDCNSVLRG
jgi:hypothetical protein